METQTSEPQSRKHSWKTHLSRWGGVISLVAIALWASQWLQTPFAPPSAAPVAAATASAPSPVADGSTQQVFVAIAKQAKAAVVNVSTSRKAQQSEAAHNPMMDDPFFRRFFGEEFDRRTPPQQKERREQGQGSGVIVTQDGYIVTNNHVVEGADEIKVLLGDKRTFKAKLVGTDPKTDVAVLKIEASNLSPLPWGNSGQLEVGEMVLAVGSPFGLNQTVTMGIISAVGRANMGIVDYEDFIQTDAAINPGNSGGALVNLKGEVIGINSAIFTRSGGYMGIGFAIPSNMARDVMTNLVTHGKVIRGWIGVSIQEMNPELAKQFGTDEGKGALVADVMEDSPAAKAKLERGDIIQGYNGTPINDPAHLRSLVAATPPGTAVKITVLREKKSQEIKLTIGELPKDLAKASSGGGSEQAQGNHALAGVTVEPVPPDRGDRPNRGRRDGGVLVTDVAPDSPADRAGLKPGDVIREINRKPVKSVQDFAATAGQLSEKSSALLLLSRGNATIFLSITP